MKIKNFIDNVCNQIKYKPARKDIAEELQLHIEDIKDNYLCKGYQEKEAEEKAVEQMGKAEEIGKKLNKIHRPQLDWKLIILVCVLICFGFLVALNRGFETVADPERISDYVGITLSATFGAYIFTLIIGGLCGTVIYLIDYRKMSKYSLLMYIIAIILNVTAYIYGVPLGGNILWGLPIIRVSPIVITIPLYVISFVGFISNNVRKNKLVLLGVFSLITLIIVNYESAFVVAIVYAIILTVKLLKTSKYKIRSFIKIWIIPLLMLILFVFSTMITVNCKWDADYPSEYFIKETKIIDNAKFFGKAESMNINKSFFVKNTSFAFFSILGNFGWFVSGAMIIAVILLNIKLILNAKKIKDIYGKLIIIGIASVFILETIGSLLMTLLGLPSEFNIPLVSYGKVSLIMNIMCLALVLSVYRRKNINTYNAKSKSLFEKSAGVIAYRKINGEPHYLIIYSKKNFSGFPKGHIEYGEKEEDTAKRELLEEAGIKVELKKGFRETISYTVFDTPIQKEVVFFLGEMAENEIVNINNKEISKFEMVTFDKAKKILNEELMNVLRSAKEYIDKN